MIDYFELCVCPEPFNPWSEVLVAHLAEMGFESFVEEEPFLKAYLPASLVSHVAWESVLNNLSERGVKLSYSTNSIEGQNWNRMWEEQFEPVDLGNVLIIAPFHDLDPQNKKVIRILPKMSFGTGHHQTTAMMCQGMEKWDFKGTRVLDFGCGTGILAILAEQLGAKEVLAVDNDPWCIENSLENISANGSSKITIQQVNSAIQPRDFDIIIANVNRHIIEANMVELSQVSNSNSILILSGLLIEDQIDMISLASQNNWHFKQAQPLNGWVSLLFNKAS